MSFVLDASTALSWCFQDEGSDDSLTILRALQSSEGIVPAIWGLEVVNGLLMDRAYVIREGESVTRDVTTKPFTWPIGKKGDGHHHHAAVSGR